MYDVGYQAALERMGIEKTAGLGTTFARWGAKAAPMMKSFGKNLKTNLIGNPRRFYQELKGGKAFGPDSLIREGFSAPKLWQKGLLYGLPAVSAIATLRSDDPDKAGAVGGLLGSTLLGTAAFGPLGMLGSLPASFAGEWAGRRLVHGTQNVLGVGNKPPSSYTSMQQYGERPGF